jgi:DNA-binding NtrC family response regulator
MSDASNYPPEIPAPPLSPIEVVPLLIGSTVGEIERELVLQTLIRCRGNRTRAARLLGFSVRTLRNKIRLYSAEGADVPAPSD